MYTDCLMISYCVSVAKVSMWLLAKFMQSVRHINVPIYCLSKLWDVEVNWFLFSLETRPKIKYIKENIRADIEMCKNCLQLIDLVYRLID
jgi:hypothetical protein